MCGACRQFCLPDAAASGCAFGGTKVALQPIVDVAHLVHGPTACEDNSGDNRHSAFSVTGAGRFHAGPHPLGRSGAVHRARAARVTSFSITMPSGEGWPPTFVQTIDDAKCIGCTACTKICPKKCCTHPAAPA
jgi:ferredoxin